MDERSNLSPSYSAEKTQDDNYVVMIKDKVTANQNEDKLKDKLELLPEQYRQSFMHLEIDIYCLSALSLQDLRPADFPVRHPNELKDNTPINSRVRSLPLKHDNLLREQLDKMLVARIIPPASFTWSFSSCYRFEEG